MRRWFQNSLGILLIAASALGVYNVASDNTEVEQLAKEVACGGGAGKPAQLGCTAQKSQMVRTPWAQTFDFATSAVATKKSASVTVRCMRSAVLLGEYGCELR
jgi:hypothetical protein